MSYLKVTNQRQFAHELRTVARRLNIGLDQAVQKVVFDTYKGVTEKNPVDTGYSRASWNLSVDQPDASLPDQKGFQNSTGAEEAAAKRNEIQLKRLRRGAHYYITNSVPYIVHIEEGTSKQTGKHMVARTIQEVQQNVRKTFQALVKP